MKKLVVLVSLMTMFFAVSAYSQVKIGLVDFVESVEKSKKGKALIAELEKKELEIRNKLDPKKEQIEKLWADFQAQEKALTDSARQNKQNEIMAQYEQYQALYEAELNAFQVYQESAYSSVREGVKKAISEVGAEGGYDLILESSDIYYGKKSEDITQKVIKKYDSMSSN